MAHLDKFCRLCQLCHILFLTKFDSSKLLNCQIFFE